MTMPTAHDGSNQDLAEAVRAWFRRNLPGFQPDYITMHAPGLPVPVQLPILPGPAPQPPARP